jgi:hypothetical protein
LRGGGKAGCGRVAGATAAGAEGAVATELLAVGCAAGAVILAAVLGTTLRAIGRGLGNGTFGLAQASSAKTDNPTASARIVASAVDRSAVARENRVTAFLRGESINLSSPAHDPPKCGRMGEKIMRFFNSLERYRTQNRISLLLTAP